MIYFTTQEMLRHITPVKLLSFLFTCQLFPTVSSIYAKLR